MTTQAPNATVEALAEALYSFHSWEPETARSEARSIASALSREGYRLVPVEEWERLRTALDWIAEKADSFCPDCDDAVPPMPECLNSVHVISVKARAALSESHP